MSNMPKSMTTQWGLQPGARGEMIQSDMPGFRNQGDRINRTQMKLNTSKHDIVNTKYGVDKRLPVLFRYGYAYGYNQMVMPKGRMVAADPFVDQLDFDMLSQVNTLTLSNGGVPVKVRTEEDIYPEFDGENKITHIVSQDMQGAEVASVGKEFAPVIGFDKAYTERTYRPFREGGPSKQLEENGYEVDPVTGYIIEDGKVAEDVIPGNTPIGMLAKNQYTTDDAAFNGMMPGAILTDALVELPWFAYKDKAEQNPWGSVYGNLTPGTLVKSDENGRIVVSPLNFEEELEDMEVLELELERQQVIGTVINVNQNLVPEGSAKYVTWALEDRLMFDEFNPWIDGGNLRRGEDIINSSPYKPSGEYPGYPFDRTYGEHELHMLNSSRRYSHRMPHEYQVENLGIPGLTDGKNVGKRKHEELIGKIHFAGEEEYRPQQFRTGKVDLVKDSIRMRIGEKGEFQNVNLGAKIEYDGEELVEIVYCDEKQGAIVLKVIDKETGDKVLEEEKDGLRIYVEYEKKGLAGVPTFMDWDGVVGSAHILLQK